MATITVSNSSQLSSAMSVARPGDTILLGSGNYGDVLISSKSFSDSITIKSMDADNPAVFHSLNIKASTGIDFQGVVVDFTPTASTLSFSSAVNIEKSSDISFSDGLIKGGPAINGVPMTATALDSTGNVIGLPTGRGITIIGSSKVAVENTEITSLHRGIVLNNASDVVIRGNEIHDLRGSGIVGGGSQITIDNNDFSSSHPWRWGQSGGDHADFIALWTDANQVVGANDIKITNNVLSQGDGAPLLGMWVSGSSALGYSNVTITNNAILGGDYQGIMLMNVAGGSISHNTMLQTNGGYTSPSVLLLSGASGITVSENIAWQITDRNAGTTGNVITDNTMIQHSTTTGIAQDTLLMSKLAAMLDAGAIYTLADSTLDAGIVGGGVIVKPAPDVIATPAPAPAPAPTNNLVGTSSADTITGTSGDDTIDGRGGADNLVGGSGNDTYIVPNSLAKITEAAGGGIDTVIAKGDHVLAANVENLVISSDAGNSWSGTGNALNNVITGNAGANLIDGGAGNDTIFGGAGADIIVGGSGNDRLTGGEAADTFRFKIGSGADVITDFGAGGRDVIDLSDYFKIGAKAVVTDTGDDTVIKLSTGDTITLVGVDAYHVTATKLGFIYT